jgi:hypothetical protein
MLCFDQATMGANNEWARRVTADKLESVPVQAVDVDSLISMTDYHQISVLKIDIEGPSESCSRVIASPGSTERKTSASSSMTINAAWSSTKRSAGKALRYQPRAN